MLTAPRGPRTALAVGVCLVFWRVLIVPHMTQASFGEVWWVTWLFVLCCLPSILFIAGHRVRIPLMPIWGLLYFMMFGNLFLSDAAHQELLSIGPDIVVAALRLTVIGAAMCLLMFYSPLGQWAERMAPRTRMCWNARRAPLLGTGLILVGLASTVLSRLVPASLGQAVGLMTQMASIGMLCLLLLQLRGQLSWRLRFFLWGVVVPAQILIGLGSGFLYQVIWSLVPLLLCYAAERRAVPWKAILIAAACLIPFSGAKQEYRSYAWQGALGAVEITESPLQRGLTFVQLAFQRLAEGGTSHYSEALETTQLRASQLSTLIAVLELTPTVVPFWRGETYADFLWSFVPRVIAPDKPERVLGQTFGHRYGFLDPWDNETSYNVPYQVIEMYMNFGTIGVVVGMALIGLLYRALAAFLAHPNTGERELIIGCVLFMMLLNLEVDFSLVFGGVAWFLVIMTFALRVLMRLPDWTPPEGERPASEIGGRR